MKNILVVADCETGGLDATANPITQIAATLVDPVTLRELDSFDTFVQPYGEEWEVGKEALQRTHVTMRDLQNGLPYKQACNEFIKFLKKANPTGKTKPILVGHNIGFDVDFFTVLFYLSNKKVWDYLHPVPIDTMTEVKTIEAGQLAKDESTLYNLGACCGRFGIKLTNAHGAPADVKATVELLKVITQIKRSAYQAFRTGNTVILNNTPAGKDGTVRKKQRTNFFFEI